VDRSPPKPLLLGRHLLELGMPPGPKMGELLKQAYEKQLDGDLATTESAIDYARDLLKAGG
jgi:tRNA nucleotidyltransferase (CCA-adding enzyme)